MGCLKKLIHKIIFLAAVIAFFYFGGFSFVMEKYNEFTSPPREELIMYSRDYGNFSGISSDYRLTRSINVGGYRKFNAQYMPTGQKITIVDLNTDDLITTNDFYSKQIDAKIQDVLAKTKDSVVTLENLEITARGTIAAKGKTIPYVNFKADVKNVPFKTVEGMIGAYTSTNISKAKRNKLADSSVKLIISMRDVKKYKQQVTVDFVKDIKF